MSPANMGWEYFIVSATTKLTFLPRKGVVNHAKSNAETWLESTSIAPCFFCARKLSESSDLAPNRSLNTPHTAMSSI